MYVRGHDGIGGGGIVHSNYPETVLFHYGKSRLHFFTSLCGKMRGRGGGGCPIRRIMWKEGHLITGVPGNRILRPPPSTSTTASRPLFASWTQSWHRKGRRGEERRKGGCPFYSRAVGTPSPPFLSLPFFTLLLSLFSPPSSFLLFAPISQDSEIPSIGQLRNLRPA